MGREFRKINGQSGEPRKKRVKKIPAKGKVLFLFSKGASEKMTGAERNLLIQFEKIAKHVRENSFRTRKRYRWIFVQFLRFVALTFHLQNLRNLKEKHVIAYVRKLESENKAKTTILTHISAIRFYFRKIGLPDISKNSAIFSMSKKLTQN